MRVRNRKPKLTNGLRPTRLDPTRTGAIRRRFAAQLRAQFGALKARILRFVGDGDALGLRNPVNRELVGNVARDEMPQVRKADWDEFLAFARARTTVTREDNVDPNTLHAVQHEFDQARVDAIPQDKLKYPILVTEDGYVIDGNHRWIKAKQTATYIPVLRIGLEKDAALDMVRSFPKAEFVANAEEFRYQSDPDKVTAFQEWLQTQYNTLLVGTAQELLWQRFAEEGFTKGAGRAFDDVRVNQRAAKAAERGQDAALDFTKETRKEFLRSSFGRPVAIDKIKLLAGRSFSDLKNVTSDMSAKIMRGLVDGMAQGKGPLAIARDMVKVVGLGLDRALLISKHEMARAHNEGMLLSFKKLGVTHLGVAVEWTNSGYSKCSKLPKGKRKNNEPCVCRLCEALEGIVISIDEARGLLPRHIGCMCSWTSANVGEKSAKQVRGQREVARAIAKSISLGVPAYKKENPDWIDDYRGWAADTKISAERPNSILGNRLANVFNGDIERFDELARNVFCATGPGGGVDPTCGDVPHKGMPYNPITRMPPELENRIETALAEYARPDTIKAFIGYSQTIEHVPISRLSSGQVVKDVDSVRYFKDNPDEIDSTEPLPLVIQYGTHMMLRDGNSRATASMELGRMSIKARVVYIPSSKP